MKKNCANTQKCSRIFVNICCRPPHGGRGLKFHHHPLHPWHPLSAPTRGPWIEIPTEVVCIAGLYRRPPHGGRGLKCRSPAAFSRCCCRPPHGGRGLKSHTSCRETQSCRRPPHGGRGLKLGEPEMTIMELMSAPTRGPWIEIIVTINQEIAVTVGPHTGAVD